MNGRVYRDAPDTNVVEPMPRKPSRVVTSISLVAAYVAYSALKSVSGSTLDRFSDRMVVLGITLAGCAIVIGIKRVHAAWKKRHDAKLMIEWERRLEEKR